MKLYEYQAKDILRQYGIETPVSLVISGIEPIGEFFKKYSCAVLKAQVPVAGRAKAGGVKKAATQKEAENIAREMFKMSLKGFSVKKILLEEAVEYQKELYLGFSLDTSLRKNILMFSTSGGVDIEELAQKRPQEILKIPLTCCEGVKGEIIERIISFSGLEGEITENLTGIVKNLYQLYKDKDCQLAEINPLVVTGNKFLALDAKIIIDDNALYRQPEIKILQEDTISDNLERRAREEKIAYVHLGGNIGVIGNGAGLVMATMDEVKRAGARPANFLDIGGGAGKEVMKKSLRLVLQDPEVKGIFINIFGGITRCDEVAKGISEATRELTKKIPIVVRLSGTNSQTGISILKKAGIEPVEEMKQGAARIVNIVRSKDAPGGLKVKGCC